MSGRTVPRFVLAGLLAVAFAAPAAAQPLPAAPMPREVRYAVMSTHHEHLWWDTEPEVAPMPRAKTGIQIEFELGFGPTPYGRGPGAARPAQWHFQGCWQTLNEDVYNLARSMPQPPPVAPLPRECPDELAELQRHLAELQRLMAQLPPPAPREFIAVGPDGYQPVPIVPPGGYWMPPGCCLPPVLRAYDPVPAANPLVGTWYRDTGVGVVAATFTPDELKLCLTQRDGGTTATFTLTAHYTLTKDGLVYGAVTGADVDATHDGKGTVGIELAELSLALQELTDRPFSFRAKVTSGGLMVSQLKAASGEQFRAQELAVLGGLYKSARDGKVPAPGPLKTVGGVGKCDSVYNPADYSVTIPTDQYRPLLGAAVGSASGTAVGAQIGASVDKPALREMPLPPPPATSEPVQRIGIDFNISPPQVLPPAGGARIIVPPAAPPACNDAMKAMAADAFSQMIRPTGGVTLPAPPSVNAVDPGYPDRYDTAARQPVLAPFAVQVQNGTSVPKPAHVGTWVRTIGAKQCVVRVEADHLTITVSEAREFDGNTVTGHLIFTADYHLTRDGLTAVGLFTSVDAKFDGDLPGDEEEGMLEKVAELRKALEEKPFALTFRRYGEALVIGNVRMPDVGDQLEAQPGTYVGGRYASVGDKPLPKLKVVKAPPVPQFIPPSPNAGPVSDLLPSQGVPGPIIVPRPGNYGYGPPAQTPRFVPYEPAAGASVVPTGDVLLPPQAIPHPATRPVDWAAPVPRQRVIQDLPTPVAPPTPQPMVMPQPTAPTRVMPQPTPLALDLGFPVVPSLAQTPKTDRDTTRQLFNFYVGFFGNQ